MSETLYSGPPLRNPRRDWISSEDSLCMDIMKDIPSLYVGRPGAAVEGSSGAEPAPDSARRDRARAVSMHPSNSIQSEDAYVALQHMREAVLGSIHGSKRHGRKCVLFNVMPGEGVPKDPSRILQKRLDILGARCGTPPRCTHVEVPPTTEASARARPPAEGGPPPPDALICGLQQPQQEVRPTHGRRESCPTEALFIDAPRSHGAAGGERASARLYPKARSCDSKVQAAELRSSSRTKLPAGKMAQSVPTGMSRAAAGGAGGAGGGHTACSELVIASTAEAAEEGWCHEALSPQLPLPPRSPNTSTITITHKSPKARPRSSLGLAPAAPSRLGELQLGRSSAPMPHPFPSLVAQSDPLLSSSRTELGLEDEPHEYLGDVGTDRFHERPGARQAVPSSRTGPAAQLARVVGLRGRSPRYGSSSLRGLWRHMSGDASAWGPSRAISGQKPSGPPVQGTSRKAPKRVGPTLGARMTPDEHARAYYAVDP